MNTELTTIMQIVCAWCGKHVAEKRCPAQPWRMAVSHTICPACKQEMEAELERLKRRSAELHLTALGRERS